MQRYRDVYHYQRPVTRGNNYTAATKLKYGPAPDYSGGFFNQSFHYRSVSQEDKTVYSLLPDQFRALGAGGRYIELGAFDGSRDPIPASLMSA
jgi:hypothetical protein